MKYNPLGKTGLNISRLSFGASALGGVYGNVNKQWDYDAAVDRLKMNSLEGVPKWNCQEEPSL